MSNEIEPQLPEWAQEATFGIFVHWGPYSVAAWAETIGVWGNVPEGQWFRHNAYAEWYANTIRIEGSPASEHHAATYGGAPYADLIHRWSASSWDPDDWARLFSGVGADYVVLVTKHHDGVTLWDAPGSGQSNTVRQGPKRDLVAPLARAVRNEGMKFGVYYSGGLDWGFANHPPIQSIADVEKFRPVDAAYGDYAVAQVRDLIDRFAPSVVWNDIDWPDASKVDGSLAGLMAYYKDQVPDGIVNDRWGTPDVGDYKTSEYEYGLDNETGVGWEHNRGLGFSFGYNHNEGPAETLTTRELARLWADIVSRGGRLLLNVGPDESGQIPDLQLRPLKGFGAWLEGVKPHTVDRVIGVGPHFSVRDAHGGETWFRAWRSGTGSVVVVTEHDTDVVESSEDEQIIRFTLPD